MSYTKQTDFAVQGVLSSNEIQRNIRGTALDTEFDALEAGVQSSVSVKEFGAVGDGVTDDTAAIQAAINSTVDVFFPKGVYLAGLLTQSTNEQRFSGAGGAKIKKNANGALFTSTGHNVQLESLIFSGDSVTPVFTGHNVVLNGDHPSLINCGSRWAFARAVKATGAHVQILGTNDIYHTSDATASGYDIEIGSDATATLYHQLTNVYTSQATGGIKLRNTGTSSIKGGQFGKLTIEAGAALTGSAGPYVTACRVNGDVTVHQSNSVLSDMTISGDVILGDGSIAYSGIVFAETTRLQAGSTLTINDFINDSVIHTRQLSSANVVVNLNDANDVNNSISYRSISFTPVWLGATTNPVIGNGVLTGSYSRDGNTYTLRINLQVGSTTTLGSGEWSFSLPATPDGTYTCVGRIFDSGTSFNMVTGQTTGNKLVAYAEGANQSLRSNNPIVWTTNDTLGFVLVFNK